MRIRSKGQYYGRKRSELNEEGLVLSEYDYFDPETEWHYHENPYFMYVLEGDMYDVDRKGRTALSAGSLVFHNWQEPHQNTKASRLAGGFHIEMTRSWLEAKGLDADLWEGSQVVEHPTLHHLVAKLRMEFHQRDELSDLSIELLLFQICDGMKNEDFDHAGFRPPWLAPLKEILRESKTKLSLNFLSDELGVHPVHLSRAIPKYLSTNLGDYLRQQKVKQALGLLLDPKLSLTEIAYRCGFADQSHFTRTFKKYFNCTPKSYRRQRNCCRG